MKHSRYNVLDAIRGIAIINMVVYHGVWNMVYIFGFDWKWYESKAAYVWQQGICWTFILLSGFCWLLGKRQLKRGVFVFLGGALISAVTFFFMPENVILFGILTLIGSCMIFMVPLHRILQRVSPFIGTMVSFLLFLFTKSITRGYVGFAGWKMWELPESRNRNLLTTYFGLPSHGFYSADYFPIFPWFFLFVTGYFLYRYLENRNLLKYFSASRVPILEWTGRHSLVIYMLHQPILYLGMSLLF